MNTIIDRTKQFPDQIPLDDLITTGILDKYQLVIVERAKKMDSSTFYIFRDYVMKGKQNEFASDPPVKIFVAFAKDRKFLARTIWACFTAASTICHHWPEPPCGGFAICLLPSPVFALWRMMGLGVDRAMSISSRPLSRPSA
jgi:hypothetical protein